MNLRVLTPRRAQAPERHDCREPVRQVVAAVAHHVGGVFTHEEPEQRQHVPRGPLPVEPRHHEAVEAADGRQEVGPLHKTSREDGEVAAWRKGNGGCVSDNGLEELKWAVCERRPEMMRMDRGSS